ncbi:low molecular weight phosphatase family protein [Microbacterium ulmi]|uniref:Low molecular weight phosphatase family protein n=1 Tax=Microbacterium ulmi TaxID=179095 RepID=A0A7Y2M0N8_9MICO|nr:protein-tyrosine phosphatase [Microbacterium ulmi]NNH04295.1 low molecular weight phosphatase family protein [Microbacterium ulmi]
MFEILVVCTGNVCRSPLAGLLLRARLAPLGARISSAGTRAVADAPMTAEAVRLAVERGIDPGEAERHRSRSVTEALLSSPDLILTMTREHRRLVAELAPSRLRSTFTIREFARLAAATPAAELRQAAEEGTDAASRVRAAAAAVASHRGLVLTPGDPSDDDVVDPYRRSWATYQRSAAQLDPAVDAVVRTLWATLAPPLSGSAHGV